MAWAVRDSLWNAACAGPGRRQELTESWATRTLEAASIDISLAPPLIVAQVYNLGNFHWVLRFLMIAPGPTREYLCLKFDPLCDKPYIVGANKEEFAVVDLIAKREGIQPKQRRSWERFLEAFGDVAFAIAPLYPTFIRQVDGVSCHPACRLMLHCALSRRVVSSTLQVPQDRLWLLREMAQAALYYSHCTLAPTPGTLGMHWEVSWMYTEPKYADPPDTCFFCASTPHVTCPEGEVLPYAFHSSNHRQTEICVGLREYCQFMAPFVAPATAAAAWAAAAVVAALRQRMVPFAAKAAVTADVAGAAVTAAATTNNTCPDVWMCRKWYAVPSQCPAHVDGQLKNDQEFC